MTTPTRPNLDEIEIVVHTLKSGKTDKEIHYSYGELYAVNLNAGRVSKCPGSKLFRDDGFTSMVALGNVIYILGGNQQHQPEDAIYESDQHLHSKASYIDLKKIDGRWNSIPSFHSIDFTPNCVSLQGKLFLFGRNAKNTKIPGEVFDSESGSWDFLPPVPYYGPDPDPYILTHNDVSTPAIPDHVNNCLIVHFKHNKSIYAYYPEKRNWNCLVHKTFGIWHNLVALVDGMLVFYISGTCSPFIAFDLVAKKWLKVIVSASFGASLLSYGFDALLPLASTGTLCLAACSPDSDVSDKTRLKFVKFRVERNNSGDSLVTFMSLNKLIIDGRCLVTNFVTTGTSTNIIKEKGEIDTGMKRLELKEFEIMIHAVRYGESSKGRRYSYGELYRVNLETGRVTKCPGGKLMLDEAGTSIVALGNVIYILGGVERFKLNEGETIGTGHRHSRVSYIDMTKFNGGWKTVPSYKSLDYGCACVSFKGRLFLFGMCIKNQDDTCIVGEVFDPKCSRWDLLPAPPMMDLIQHVSDPVLVDLENNRLIVYFEEEDGGSVYAYYPDECKWEFLVEFSDWHLMAIVDGMLLNHIGESSCHFLALDLETKKWLNPEVSPDFDTLPLYEYDDLIPLNPPGTFCLAVNDSMGFYMPDITRIKFVKFRVERTKYQDPSITFISEHNVIIDIDSGCYVAGYAPV